MGSMSKNSGMQMLRVACADSWPRAVATLDYAMVDYEKQLCCALESTECHLMQASHQVPITLRFVDPGNQSQNKQRQCDICEVRRDKHAVPVARCSSIPPTAEQMVLLDVADTVACTPLPVCLGSRCQESCSAQCLLMHGLLRPRVWGCPQREG
jgi:hypothetical protein